MSDTTKAEVLKTAPLLSTVSTDRWTQALVTAALEFTEDDYGDYEEIVQRYYLAHILTLEESNSGSGGSVKRERVGTREIEKEYGTAYRDDWYKSTKFGPIFKFYYLKYRKLRYI